MRLPNRAILLLAGRGRRLGRLTERCPKCLLEVAGMPIIERTLRSLSDCGVSEAVLVVGYRSEQVRSFAGSRYGNLEITYVLNERHAETNTAYSLWLARDYLDTDCLLVEGDILFDAATLKHVLLCSHRDPVWAVVPVSPGNDEGILLRKDAAGRVLSVELVRELNGHRPSAYYKCAGIQLLTAATAGLFAARLDAAITTGQTRIFADLVLGEVVADSSMRLCSLEGLRWAEVDDPEDFQNAKALFTGDWLSGPGRPDDLVPSSE